MRPFCLTLLLLLLSVVVVHATPETPGNTWTIQKITQDFANDGFDIHVTTRSEGMEIRYSHLLHYNEYTMFRRYFKAKYEFDLEGKSFTTPIVVKKADATTGADSKQKMVPLMRKVFGWIVAMGMSEGKYIAPSAQEIYQRVSSGLLARTTASFMDIDPITLERAFNDILDKEGKIKDEWVTWLAVTVKDASQGKLEVVRYPNGESGRWFQLKDQKGYKVAFGIYERNIPRVQFDYLDTK